MRLHPLNCISSCPLGGSLMDGRSKGLRARLSCHCVLVEGDRDLVLVDTGFGLEDVANPLARLSRFFLFLLRPELRAEMTAVRQIRRLGFDPRDVRHVVLTHLDFDHAGGLDDFPHANVHLLAQEREAALARRTILDRMRYRPQQWSTQGSWETYDVASGPGWFGFDAIRELRGVREDVALVPLIGHTFGHAGVAIRDRDRWLLLAGDAYFHRGEMDLVRPRCTPGLRFYQWMMEKDRKLRLRNQERLRELRRAHRDRVRIVSSHDVVEFERLSGRAHDAPIGAEPRRARPAAAPATRPVPVAGT